MSQVTPKAVQEFVVDQVAPTLGAVGLSPQDVPDDFDLLAAGVIDSFGIIELISAVEDRFGCELDFADLDPEQLTVVGAFSAYVASHANGAEPEQ